MIFYNPMGSHYDYYCKSCVKCNECSRRAYMNGTNECLIMEEILKELFLVKYNEINEKENK